MFESDRPPCCATGCAAPTGDAHKDDFDLELDIAV
jgi:hypothetical protein